MIKILELFGGIGACSKALERLGIDYEIADYVEIDKYAVKSFNAMHNTNFEPQDIRTWDKNIDVDLIMHGSPCQNFSLAGKQAGGDIDSGTRSSLMYETIRIVDKLRPKYVIWENVKNLISKKHRHNFDNYLQIMEELGYNNYYQVLNAKDYGIPQNRERVFTVSIRKDLDKNFVFPKKQELKLKLKDMLEENVDEKYYIGKKRMEIIKQNLDNVFENNFIIGSSQKNAFVGDEKISPTLTAAMAEGGGQTPMIKVESNGVEKILKLMEEAIDELHFGKLKWELYEKYGVNKKCPHCGTQLLKSDLPQYKYLCFECDENFYEFESVDFEFPPTLTTSCDVGSITNDLRIRKLTPKECWRLMGFNDSNFEKAEKVNSNTQLYKQAGNSIVVNVLVEILRNLLKDAK